MTSADVPKFDALSRDDRSDVVIVGAGIAGLTTAYLLGRAGRSVIVLDGGPIISGESERTTAHLSAALDDRYSELERIHGYDGARLAAESHTAAIDEIERIVAREGIDCDFLRLDGYLFPADRGEVTDLQPELAAAHRAGLTSVESVPRAPILGFETGPALRFPRQGQFHPVRYLAELAQLIRRQGGRIFAHSQAIGIQGGNTARVQTAQGANLEAGAVVVATNSPVNDRVVIHTKQAPYRTYVIAATVARGKVPTALFWDTADPYHYVRLQSARGDETYDTLIVGGEDHKTGHAEDAPARFHRLEEWTRQRFAIREVTHRWSGQVMEPVDGLAFIGRNPLDHENVYIATGDSGHGMTHGTIAGLLLTDLITGRENPWASLYDPSRTPKAAAELARENATMAAQYTKWVTPGDVSEPDAIARDSGAVVRRGLTKAAVYRDASGKLHECSAICPHLGGIVSWNPAEKTWDCPVHGSRFDRFGKVVNGPARTDLRPARNPAPAPP